MYLLLWPEDGIIRKEDVRGVFDGSIFFKKAEETKMRRLAAKKQKEQERSAKKVR